MIKTKLAGVAQFLSWPLVFLLFKPFLNIKINGRENFQKITPPFIIISNHISFYDSFLFRLICGFFTYKLPLRFMAVRKFSNPYLNFLSDIKLIDLMYAIFGVFVVVPGRGIDKNLVEAEQIIHNGGNIVLYPEGSVVKDGQIRDFKAGAAVLTQKTGVTVLPVSMRFGKKSFFRRELVINIGEFIKLDRHIPVSKVTDIFHERIVELYKRV